MGAIWGAFVGFLEQVLLKFSEFTGSAGIGIILFTVVARLVILPLTLTAVRSSRKMQELQPQIKELQRKYGKEPQKLQEETLKLYKQFNVNPAASCLPLFLQLPIFFGVYQAVYHLMIPAQHVNLSPMVKAAIEQPAIKELLARPFLGLNLGLGAFGPGGFSHFNGVPYMILPILSVVLQLVQQVMAMPRVQDPQQKAMTQAMLFMPLFFAYIAFTFPSGAVFYWVIGSIIGITQQYFTAGWGSLANYLKFLPPDKTRTPPLVRTIEDPTTGEAVAVGGASGDLAVAQPKMSFWDVLRPLNEQPQGDEGGAAAATGGDASEQAIASARTQGRALQQRRARRRR